MLVLSRKIGEVVMIGNDVTLMVIGVHGNQIRLGVHAPRDVEIHREEVYLQIRQGESTGQGEAACQD